MRLENEYVHESVAVVEEVLYWNWLDCGNGINIYRVKAECVYGEKP